MVEVAVNNVLSGKIYVIKMAFAIIKKAKLPAFIIPTQPFIKCICSPYETRLVSLSVQPERRYNTYPTQVFPRPVLRLRAPPGPAAGLSLAAMEKRISQYWLQLKGELTLSGHSILYTPVINEHSYISVRVHEYKELNNPSNVPEKIPFL